MSDELFIINWNDVKAETMDLLNNGKAKVVNGVARNIADKYKIIQHMPFKKVAYSGGKDLLKTVESVQNAQVLLTGAVALSTLSIIGAIIISTNYLVGKLNVIQKKIDLIHKEIQDQNILYYFNKVSAYFGAIEATRELICSEKVVKENKDLLVMKLSELSRLRNELFPFLDNLIFISDNFTLEHKMIAIDFVNTTFDLLPKGLFIESQAAYKIERFYLGDSIRENGISKYSHSIDLYKNWANAKYQAIVAGNPSSNTQVLKDKFQDIKKLISSEENKLMLKQPI